jgi:hypothetical protein
MSMTSIDLRTVFLQLQREMIAKLSADRVVVTHPSTKGDATELSWIEMLNQYLPKRYQAAKAFVLDSEGSLSEQIDIVIFDRQYSPFLFNHNGALYVPAESVYGVMEVKPELSKEELLYAGSKAQSVRLLRRTSAPIPHAGGKFQPRSLFEIVAGIVTLKSGWSPPFGTSFEEAIAGLETKARVHLGCALRSGAFEVEYPENGKPRIEISESDDALIFFFLHLLSRLQSLGTVPAIDIGKYARFLKTK